MGSGGVQGVHGVPEISGGISGGFSRVQQGSGGFRRVQEGLLADLCECPNVTQPDSWREPRRSPLGAATAANMLQPGPE